MTRRLKVLVSAYACEPDKGSEPGVGWNWVKQIGRFHNVWVITRENNKEPISRALEKAPLPNVSWVYFDLPGWARFWKKGRRGVHLYYCLWQLGAYFVAKSLHKEKNFDLVHHATFVNYWLPSFLVLLPVPFIWGPVGGGESAPRAFYRNLSFRCELYEHLRSLIRLVARWDIFLRLTARRARLVLATTMETAERVQQLGARYVEVFSQVALPTEELEKLSAIPLHNDNPFRLASVGNLYHFKGFHLGLVAFAQFQQEFPNSEYYFIGDGPERQNLERLAKKFGVATKVRFWGNLSRHEVMEKLADSDVLVQPALHDSGGWVCVEAMAAGRPVVCLDLGGLAIQVTEDTGFKVPPITPEQSVSDLAESILKLARDYDLRKQMGEAAQKRAVEHFSWDKKGDRMREIYQRICNQCEY